MRIIITAYEAIEKGIWINLCELKGINEWSVKEGLMSGEDEISLTESEAQRLGII